jgi:hypothetical protein
MDLEGPRLDGMSIYVERDSETAEHVDYFFVCDVRDRDPRYKSRWMVVGQRRGLFRIRKANNVAELLAPMEFDQAGKCFLRASSKVLAVLGEVGEFPAKTQVAIG